MEKNIQQLVSSIPKRLLSVAKRKGDVMFCGFVSLDPELTNTVYVYIVRKASALSIDFLWDLDQEAG